MAALRTLVLLALIAAVCSGQTSDCSYFSLVRHLGLTTDSKLHNIRPVRNWTTPTIVFIDMLLYGILQVDEKSQTVTSHIWIQMGWGHEFLSWTPSDFCGIDVVSVPTSLLWIPDISIQEDISDTGSIYNGPLSNVHAEGWVQRDARQRLTSTCKLQLSLFPFDTQRCNFTFASLSSDARSIRVRAFHNDTVLTKMSELFMITHGEWALSGLDIIVENFIKNGAPQSNLKYRVTICRKPMLYVVILIVPLFYLLVLDMASFFISEARGEKLSFKVTVLLSISVLLLILQDMLPSTEDRLPMIANYCVAIFALVGISVLEAMLVSFLTDLDGYCARKTPKSANVQEEIHLEVGHLAEPEEKDKGCLALDGPSGRKLLKEILEEVKAARQNVKTEQANTGPGYYRRVAEIIDTVFFAFYLITIITFLSTMYVMWFGQCVE